MPTIHDAIAQSDALALTLRAIRDAQNGPPPHAQHGPATPAPGGAASGTTLPAPAAAPHQLIGYPVERASLTDAMFLSKMEADYDARFALTPGSHQLFFDILTSGGRTSAQMTGAEQQTMQAQVNRLIKLAGVDYAAETQRFDASTYAGPLVSIYHNLVDAKLRGAA